MDHKLVKKLLGRIGIPDQFSIESVAGGMNNKVFCVSTNDRKFLLKCYFSHPDDNRDRLRTEYAFLEFAANCNIFCVPKPVAVDPENQIALYEFISGRPLDLDEVTTENVESAIAFYFDLNRHRFHECAVRLPNGSEACFTYMDHFSCVESRVDRLSLVADSEAKKIITRKLYFAWKEAQEFAIDQLKRSAIDPNLQISKKMLSPSDFGFHNAILTNSGELYFVDFEYAGWDNPSKTICDFFCQPKFPVSLDHYPIWFSNFQDRDVECAVDFAVRTLLPLYRVKWCCILLNHFLTVGEKRREFSNEIVDIDIQRRIQLEKVEDVLHRLFEFPA